MWVCLQKSMEAGDPLALAIMGELFDLSRDDFEGRCALDPVVEAWRQKSRAPVHEAGLPELWR